MLAIADTKLYVPVVTILTQDDNKLLQRLKTGFKQTIKWNKYKSEICNQTKNNNLNYLIDPTFNKVNKLFVLSYEMRTIERLFQNIIHQPSRLKTIMCWLMVKVSLTFL